jgi:hypothetical protein
MRDAARPSPNGLLAPRIAACAAGSSSSAAAAATMAGYISTEQYLWGLRRILDGITAVRDDGQLRDQR